MEREKLVALGQRVGLRTADETRLAWCLAVDSMGGGSQCEADPDKLPPPAKFRGQVTDIRSSAYGWGDN